MVLKGRATWQRHYPPRKLIPSPALVSLPTQTAKPLYLISLSISTILSDFLGMLAMFT